MLRETMQEMAWVYAEATSRVKCLMETCLPNVETVDDISRMFESYLEKDKDKADVWDGIYEGLDTETKKFCTDIAFTTLEIVGLITKKQADEFFGELFPEK